MMRYILIALMMSCILSCKTAPPKAKTAVTPVKKEESPAPKSTPSIPDQRAQMQFTGYNDDGDYFLLLAHKGDSAYSFVNNDDNRTLNRGDLIEISWKRGTIIMAGDGDTPADADIITHVKKLGDGTLTKFKNTYGKKLKYTWAKDEEYSQYYLDKLNLLVEYYLANTKVPLLQQIISKKEDISYSIEQQTKNNHENTMIGISTTNEHRPNTIQWLYFDNEHELLYEYDLPNHELILFH